MPNGAASFFQQSFGFIDISHGLLKANQNAATASIWGESGVLPLCEIV
jgi:hypothetical protein